MRRIVRRIRRHWPKTKLTIRGDSHYGRPEAMKWCEGNGIDYVFGLAGNTVLSALVDVQAGDVRTRRALENLPALRGYAEVRYEAGTWKQKRRACARIEATTLGLDIRFVVANIKTGSAGRIYDVLYCERGNMENLIKLHKSQLKSDRTSCRSPLANQMRPILHTAAYWLMPARCHSQDRPAGGGRIQDDPRAAAENRRAGCRDRQQSPPRFRRRLPAGLAVPPAVRGPATRRSMKQGAAIAPPPIPETPARCRKVTDRKAQGSRSRPASNVTPSRNPRCENEPGE